MKLLKSLHSAQRGSAVLLLALIIIVLFACAALAIDLGVLFTARTSAQHAADAGALAGAFTFLNPSAAQPAAATDAAITASQKNAILGKPAQITAGNVQVDVAARRVTVTVPRTGANGIGLFFAKAINIVSADVQAQATAEAAAGGTGSACIKPIYIPNTILSAQSVTNACKAGQVIFDSQGNLTAFAKSKLGTQLSIRPTDPSNALLPGQFFSLNFGSGASTYSCTLGQCANYCSVNQSVISCGSSYPLKTGNMVGPTSQGISTLIGNPPDTWVAVGQYSSGGVISDTSRSLVTAPVWDDCTQVISPGYKGQTVKVVGFLEMFVDGMQGSSVQAHVVNEIACSVTGSGGSGATGGNTGPLGVPIRLVQKP